MSSQEDSTMSELTDDEPVTTATDIHPDDPDDEWSSAGVKSGLRLHVPTAVLLGLIILAGGFWGGAVAEKHHGSGSAASASPLSALARQFAAARGASGAGGTTAGGTSARGGAGGGAAGFGAAATGTVIGVTGQTLDISNASGNIVKVKIAPSTTITRTSKSSLTGLQVGDTVVIAGSTASNGVVSATSVRASAAGVTTGGTGLGGTGFAGSGSGGSGLSGVGG
jgi:hypothetical protein